MTLPTGELLIFEHPTAGRQLPAGSAEPGEDLEVAVRREIREESGLVVEGPVELLRVLETNLAPEKGVMSETTTLFETAECRTKREGAKIRRGVTVKTEERREEAVNVRYDEFDYNQTPPVLLRSVQGWAPRANVADKMSRALFHVPFEGDRTARWEYAADAHVFRFLWVPLLPRPQLIAGQQEWLDAVYDELLRRTIG